MGEPLIPNGYVLVARKTLESGIFSKPPLYLKVWVYLLSHAQHKDFRGLKRGQLRTSIPEMQDALSWKVGYRTEKPTKKQIFTILEWLRNPNEGVHEGNDGGPMIVTTKGTQGMVVTICNYSFYQTPENYEGNNERNAKGTTKSLRPERQGNNINKNDKNDKNVKNIDVDDDKGVDIYQTYQEVFGVLNPLMSQNLEQWAEDLTPELVNEALIRSGTQGAKKFSYTEVILRNWEKEGVKTVEDIAALDAKREKNNRKPAPAKKAQRESNSGVSF